MAILVAVTRLPLDIVALQSGGRGRARRLRMENSLIIGTDILGMFLFYRLSRP